MTVAVGDGAGVLGAEALAALSSVARDVGSLRLVLGWLPTPATGLDPDAFAEVLVLMPSGAGRELLAGPAARYVPARLSAWPALLAGPLRPDLLITRLVQRDGLLHFGSEVSYQHGLARAGVPILAVLDDKTPAAGAEPPLSPDQVSIIAAGSEPPARLHREPDPVHEQLADAVLRFVPAGARLQYGPGPLGTALLRRTAVPLRLDTGLLTDAVVDLDRRGLLIGQPSATYLVGSEELYDWADGRPILRGIEHTHDLTRLARGEPFIAVNTAVEIDFSGQVNVEGVGEKIIGGIGGHPDYCAAARAHRSGLSIIATPATVNGRSPLVEQLSRPASTPAHDVDVIVTESGHADLRDADWPQRRKLITELFAV
ncbi:acetyl-CoA hydrolase/transferase C-terminal domain-containing protein [Mycobacterium branderi]|nr:acetyl-CoA hydrolase/transferase C-terminal domain-containing protein [Mycobacterium branderi]MCV7231775.1 acetyl-CoA hydrolase [Mycobacterium branderi]